MNSKKLKESIDVFKDYLGDALISSDIWEKNGLSIASYKSNERYTALFARIIKNMEMALDDLNFPPFGEYQLIDLEANYLLLIINFKQKYVWGSLIDKTKVSLGEIIFIAIHKAKTSFKEAME
jgi:hypothetical protein